MSDADPYDRLERAAEKVATSATDLAERVQQAEWERLNRVSLLWGHSGMGAIAGLQMIAFGSAANIEQLVGLWSRTALGALGVIGGLILAVGIIIGRRIWIEAAGLALLGIWDLLMACGFIAARIQAGDFGLRGLTEPLPDPGTYALPYPIAIYLGMCYLVCVHLVTLRRIHRAGKAVHS